MSRIVRIIVPCVLLILGACGLPATSSNTAPTRTRVAELAQLATLTAPTATPFTAATQTRAVELSQLATLTVVTPTPLVSATQTRSVEQAHLVTMTAQAAPAAPPTPSPVTTPSAATTSTSVSTSVGKVSDSEAFVGLITDGSKITAYVCDGTKISQWFSSTFDGNSLDAKAPSGMRIVATVTPGGSDVFTGTVTMPDGKVMKFSTTDVSTNIQAGIYSGSGKVNDKPYSIGVIVLPDGQFRGVLSQDGVLRTVGKPAFTATGLVADVSQFGEFPAQKMTKP